MSIEKFKINGANYTAYGGDPNDPTSDFNNVPESGFDRWVGRLAPIGIGAIFGAGLLGGGGGAGAAAHSGIYPGLIANSAPNAGALLAPPGAGMKFGLGSLAKFLDSRGGSALIDAGANIYGTNKQASAATHGADLQAAAAKRALDDAMQQRQLATQAYNAWLTGGGMARLADLLGVARSTPISGPSGPSGPTPVGAGQTPGAMANSGGVTLQAPNGQTRQFAPNDPAIDHYLQQGARRVA